MVDLARAGRPLVVAHRGASGHMPENTFGSFDLAVKMGADMIELDVHPCKDGDLMVMHDDTVDRTTNGSGRVAEKSMAELKGLDAAAKSSMGRPEPIPTFAEVLDRYSKRIPLMVEVKHGSSVYPGVEERVARELRAHGAEDRVELISFDLDCLMKLRRESTSLKTGFIFIGNMASFADILKEDVDALHGMWNFVPREHVDYARSLGRAAFVWTVNTPDEIHQALNLGVDGIVSNFPDRVLESLRDR